MKSMKVSLNRFAIRPLFPAGQKIKAFEAIRTIDFHSKIYDGLLPTVVMVLITMLVPLFVFPLENAFGSPGLLVLSLVLLAIGVYMLNRCIIRSSSEITRAWYGMLAGLFLWLAIESATRIGQIQAQPSVGLILMILAGTVVMTLWKPVFPLGIKFAVLMFMLNWSGRFLIMTQVELAQGMDFFQNTVQISGFFGLVGVIFFLLWMFLQANMKIYRMWAAVGAWFSILVTMIIFLGIIV
jgi:hypothetical protein